MNNRVEYSWQVPEPIDLDAAMDRVMELMLGWEEAGVTVRGSSEVTVDGRVFIAAFDVYKPAHVVMSNLIWHAIDGDA